MDAVKQPSDDDDFVAELTNFQAALHLYVRGLMPGDPGLEEVVQQSNAVIWQKREAFELGTNFRAWALAIARIEVLNYRKQQARDRLRLSDELAETIASETTELDRDLNDHHVALRKCLDELKPESRDVLMTRYSSQESLSVLAERFGRSVGGLRVALTRLRSQLLGCVERRLRSDGGLS